MTHPEGCSCYVCEGDRAAERNLARSTQDLLVATPAPVVSSGLPWSSKLEHGAQAPLENLDCDRCGQTFGKITQGTMDAVDAYFEDSETKVLCARCSP